MGSLQPGRIVRATPPGLRGDWKEPPLIITSIWPDIRQTGMVSVICCSTKFPDPLPPGQHLLEWSDDGKGPTRLTEPTAVICNWTAVIPAEDIDHRKIRGIVPSDVLRLICREAGVPLKVSR